MITEQEFKEKLIKKLNVLNPGWRDGDIDKFVGKKADIVNDDIKIVIEIKDDTVFKMDSLSKTCYPSIIEVKSNQKGRQFKGDLKDANKKFVNYPNYKSILLLRTRMADIPRDIIEYTLRGSKTYRKINGKWILAGRPSTFFSGHDNSTKEVGVILFLGKNECLYRENTNPNVNRKRIIEKRELEELFDIQLSNLINQEQSEKIY